MTYNLSKETVKRMQAELDELLPGLEKRFSDDAPHKLAYRIREAIAAARYNKIKPYADIDFSFTIGNGYLLATPKAAPRTALAQAADTVEVCNEPANEFRVVATATQSKRKEIHFPQFDGNVNDVLRWAKEKGYEVIQGPVLVVKKP